MGFFKEDIMRNIKKIVFSIMVIFVVFAITGCSSSSDIVTFTGDRPVRGEVSGTVEERSSEDNPLEGASIRVEDSNNIVHSEPDGSYSLTGVDNNSVISVAIDGYEPELRTVEFTENEQEYNLDFRLNKVSDDIIFELTWQTGPEDLDAHLIVPAPDNTEQEGYHIYYQDQGNDSEYPDAFLDRDVLTYEKDKPEVITINELYEGRYIYFIKNFSMYDSDNREDVPEISDSEAMVRVRENGEWTEYEAPTDENGMHWHLFDIIVDENGYEIDYINEFTDDEPGLD